MRFFNNAPFMETVSELFDQPRQKLQAAPKIEQKHAIKIGQFNGQALQQNDAPINAEYSIDEAVQTKGKFLIVGQLLSYFKKPAILTGSSCCWVEMGC
jgi:hypothetical protein